MGMHQFHSGAADREKEAERLKANMREELKRIEAKRIAAGDPIFKKSESCPVIILHYISSVCTHRHLSHDPCRACTEGSAAASDTGQ